MDQSVGKYSALAVLALLASISVLSSAASDNRCIDEKVQITTEKEFGDYALKAIEMASSSCPQEVKTAIEELKSVVHNENVCSQKKADQIYQFHVNYLVDKKADLPKSFRDFFVGFALKVSKTCRDMPITRLLEASKDLITHDDWYVVRKYASNEGLLTLVIGEPDADYDGDLVPPRNLVKMLANENQKVPEEKFSLSPDTVTDIQELQSYCKSKFAPLYEPEVLSLVKLASAGYKYKDGNRALRSQEFNSQVMTWYRVMFLCESLKKVELVRSTSSSALVQDRQEVSVLSVQDAAELAKKSPELFKGRYGSGVEPIVHESATTSLNEPIIDTNNKQFMEAVEDFKARPSLFRKIAQSLGDSWKDKMARDEAKSSLSKGQGIKLGGLEIENIGELIKAIDVFRQKHRQAEKERDRPKSRKDHRGDEFTYLFSESV